MLVLIPYLPEIILAAASLLLVLAGIVFRPKSGRVIAAIFIVMVLFVAVFYGAAWNMQEYSAISLRNLILVMLMLLALVVMYSFVRHDDIEGFEMPVVMMFALVGLMVAVNAHSLMVMYLGVEIYSMSAYILTAYDRERPQSVVAASRYLLLGMLASAFIIFGISLVYGYSNTLEVRYIQTLVNPGLGLGIAMILSGIMLKIGVVPFHFWMAGVYESILTPVLTLLAVISKVSLFLVLLKFRVIGQYGGLLEVLAILSMLLGSAACLYQQNIKRMIAYLTIASSGYAMMALSIATPDAEAYMVLYLFAYAFAMFGIIAITSSLRSDAGPSENISDLAGMMKTYRLRSIALLICVFSIAGLPPLAGFFAKFYLFSEAITAGRYAMVVAGVVASVINLALGLRLVKIMYFDEGKSEFAPADTALKALVLVCMLAVLFFVLLIGNILAVVKGLIA